MGLDMYLFKETYIGAARNPHVKVSMTIQTTKSKRKKTKTIENMKIVSVEEEVAYWRKANAIHGWFLRHVYNEEPHTNRIEVKPYQLVRLLEICKTVIEKAELKPGRIFSGYLWKNGENTPTFMNGLVCNNMSELKRLLPREDGPFFGPQSYDEYYVQEVKDTIDMLKSIDFNEPNTRYFYMANW